MKAQDILLREDLHHPALIISSDVLQCKRNKTTISSTNSKRYNYRKADLTGLYQALATADWDFLADIKDVNQAFENFYSTFYSVIDQFVPKTQMNSRNFPPWFNNNVINCLKLKYKAHSDYKRSGDRIALEEFKFLRNYIKYETEILYRQYCTTMENNLKTNSKQFWQFVNNKRKTTSLPTSIIDNDREVTGLNHIVELFAEHFQRSYITSGLRNNSDADTSIVLSSEFLNISSFTVSEVLAALKKLKAKPTAGPDQIPSFVFRDCASVLAPPITVLFNLALKYNLFPDSLKISKLIPIFKKGEKQHVHNYRPITIINNLAKAFELVLYEPVYSFVKNRISDRQHGFMRGRSTSTNLFCITQYITDAFDANLQVDVAYTDFSKAFDKLDHGILLTKLTDYGFSPDLIIFFTSYLSCRSLFVEINGVKSSLFISSSGVPQGSVLGPLFFNIFINDITNNLNVHSLLYADDLKMYTTVNSVHDCSCLQSALNELHSWCILNKLPLNVSKCCVVSYSLKSNTIVFDYSLDNSLLIGNTRVKDLGVLFDSKLSFSQHIRKITGDCFRLLGYISRCSHDFHHTDTLKLLYNSFIKSRMEFGSIVWCPYYNIHTDSLERIQRRFVKLLCFKEDGVYPAVGTSHSYLLNRFSLHPLKDHRIRNDIIFVYKLIHGLIDCSDILHMFTFHVPRPSSRQHTMFTQPTPRTNIQKFSPLFRIISNCNKNCDLIDIWNCSIASIKKINYA